MHVSLTADANFSYRDRVPRRPAGRVITSDRSATKTRKSSQGYAGIALAAAAFTTLYGGAQISAPPKSVTAYSVKAISSTAEAAPQSISDRNAALSAQVIAYRSLEPDWDGDGGVVPHDAVINAALSFIDLLPLDAEPNAAMIEGTGEVGFYWNDGSSYIDITFDGREIIYYAEAVDPDSGRPFIARGRDMFDGRYMPSNLLTAISMA